MNSLNSLNIREIRNSSVIFSDGSLAAVIQVNPIEFGKASDKKKHVALDGFSRWLDTLEFPVQICARTVNLGLRNRLIVFRAVVEKHIKKKKSYGTLLSRYLRFQRWLDAFSKNFRSKRLYYITIPYIPFYKKRAEAKKAPEYLKHLDRRVENSLAILAECGLEPKRLDNSQLNNLYDSYFHFSLFDKDYVGMDHCVKSWMEAEKNEI
jgi:hypothetical protein